MVGAMRRLFARTDFQQAPIRAVVKRLNWRLRWAFNQNLWSLRLSNDLTIDVPRSGAGALIYYQGASEPTVVQFLHDFLKPGMTFVDIGAHIGEFSLLAARSVGPSGWVYAFEPNPEMAAIYRRNVRKNGLCNVDLRTCAVGDRDDEVELEVPKEPTLSRLRSVTDIEKPSNSIVMKVNCVRLDTWISEVDQKIDLIKVDVEGAEPLVLQGSRKLLGLSADESPVWLLEWHPVNWRRFSYEMSSVYELLHSFDYRLYSYSSKLGIVALNRFSDTHSLMDGNVLAIKDKKSCR